VARVRASPKRKACADGRIHYLRHRDRMNQLTPERYVVLHVREHVPTLER
jgi:hypothetical protein